MIEIQELNRTTVKANECKNEDIILSAMDIFQNTFTVNILFFYSEKLNVEKLTTSLSEVLNDFHVLAGRFTLSEKGLVISTNNHGIQFIEAECDKPIDNFSAGSIDKFELSKLIENIDPTGLINTDLPICTIKVTHLSGGGSVLGCNFAHGILDMDSLVFFMNCWSKKSLSKDYPLPTHDRMVVESFDRIEAIQKIATEELPKETYGFIRFTMDEANNFIAKTAQTIQYMQEEIFTFDKSELAQLKSKASENLHEEEWISTHDALCAHIWQVLSELRFTDKAGSSKLLFVSNVKDKMNPTLDESFFGNKVCHVVVQKSIESVCDESVSETALSIRKEIQNLSADTINGEYEWLFKNYAKGEPGVLIGNVDLYGNDFFVSSFLGFPMYEVDFGNGTPHWVTVPFMGLSWAIRLMNAKDDSGIEVHMAMTEEFMKKLKSETWQKRLHMFE